MEQFSLEKYLKNPNRKVTTRFGNREVRIICTDRKARLPIVALMVDIDGNDEYITYHTKNGWCSVEEKYPDKRDLFFADEEEELTEFEKAVKQVMWAAYNYDDFSTGKDVDDVQHVKATSKTLLDLAREEILKDLPKLEKTEGAIDPTIPVMYTYAASMKTYVEYNGYKLCINDAFEKLPKEEQQ